MADKDHSLWQEFIKGIKPLIKGSKKIEPSPLSPLKKTLKSKQSPLKLNLPPESLPIPLNAQNNLLYQGRRRLKKPQILEGTLDLHGLTQKKAFEQVEIFLTKSYRQRKRVLLVITGKGLKLKDGEQSNGVLRENLPNWLDHPALRPLVHFYAPAHLKDGSYGAYYIYLKRSRINNHFE